LLKLLLNKRKEKKEMKVMNELKGHKSIGCG